MGTKQDCGSRICAICGSEFVRQSTKVKPKRFAKRMTCSSVCYAELKARSMRARNADPEFLEYVRQLSQDQEYQKRKSDGVKAAYQRAEVRENFLTAMKKVRARPEVNEKRRQTTRVTYQSPELRARISDAVKAAHQRPEVRQRLEAYWSSDYFREHTLAAACAASGHNAKSGSLPERMLRDEFDRLGIEYIHGKAFLLKQGGGFPDFRFPEYALIVEVDGYWHTLPSSKERDSRHEQVYQEAGYQILRLDAEEVRNDAQSAAENIVLYLESEKV